MLSERKMGSEALVGVEEIANAPSENRTWYSHQTLLRLYLQATRQAMTPANLFDNFICSASTSPHRQWNIVSGGRVDENCRTNWLVMSPVPIAQWWGISLICWRHQVCFTPHQSFGSKNTLWKHYAVFLDKKVRSWKLKKHQTSVKAHKKNLQKLFAKHIPLSSNFTPNLKSVCNYRRRLCSDYVTRTRVLLEVSVVFFFFFFFFLYKPCTKLPPSSPTFRSRRRTKLFLFENVVHLFVTKCRVQWRVLLIWDQIYWSHISNTDLNDDLACHGCLLGINNAQGLPLSQTFLFQWIHEAVVTTHGSSQISVTRSHSCL